MRDKSGLHQWMVNNLEEPFLEAEIARMELAGNKNINLPKIKQYKVYFYGSLVLAAVPVAALLLYRF